MSILALALRDHRRELARCARMYGRNDVVTREIARLCREYAGALIAGGVA